MQSPVGCMPIFCQPSSRGHFNVHYIPNYVHLVSVSDAVIFLNLRLDRYSVLLGPKARAFRRMLCTTSDAIQAVSISSKENSADDWEMSRTVLSELVENHLVTSIKEDGAPTIRAHAPLPDRDLMELQPSEPRRVGLLDFLRFGRSCFHVTWQLKYSSVEAIVRSLECRKRRRKLEGDLNLDELRRLVGVYDRLRPLFPRNFLCLFDSISLVEFLAGYNFFPDIIFAVRLDPWSAHCWVQYDTVALNQDIAEAATYRPIMAV